MPILMAAASSHAPSLFFNTFDGWEKMHLRLNTGHTQPPETDLENAELVEQMILRSKANFVRLKDEYTKFNPDVIICVLGDQREWFDGSNIPNLLVYTGPDSYTHHNIGLYDEEPVPDPHTEPFRYPIRMDRNLAREILDGLIQRGFDAAHSEEVEPQVRPRIGFPHGIGHILPHSHPNLDVPIVPIFLNVDNGPPVMMSGERCVALGRAIAEICERSDKRILITGSGGMSHNPGGPRSGWVDEPQDKWFLRQLEDGNIDALKSMFSFRSEQFDGAGGELRTWLVAAAAMDYMKPGHRAAWTDYFPARKVTTGCGWVSYPPISLQEAKERQSKEMSGAR